MKDQYDNAEWYGSWNLTKDVNLQPWADIQDQTWYKTARGWFLISISNARSPQEKWFAINQCRNAITWHAWDGTLPEDVIIPLLGKGEFDLDDIELAEIFMDELA